ncbi:MAG: ribose 5-phosphate isomerase B [Acidobacteria bacterium]|nr:ribose 5-phosphate isomerase B [Acidobacteriota bacterium]
MRIAIGADHAGFALKERLREHLSLEGHAVVDHGTTSEVSCDYPDLAKAVAGAVADGSAERGILVCGSGVGMSIAANKVAGIRAALAVDEEEVRLARAHNDANILTLGSRTTGAETAGKLIDVFLATPFDAGRHIPRLGKIRAMEEEAKG